MHLFPVFNVIYYERHKSLRENSLQTQFNNLIDNYCIVWVCKPKINSPTICTPHRFAYLHLAIANPWVIEVIFVVVEQNHKFKCRIFNFFAMYCTTAENYLEQAVKYLHVLRSMSTLDMSISDVPFISPNLMTQWNEFIQMKCASNALHLTIINYKIFDINIKRFFINTSVPLDWKSIRIDFDDLLLPILD